jgi:archaetidylinositol phosphate synthase
MIATKYKAVFSVFTELPARLLVRLGVHPSAVTLLGLILVFLSCFFLLAGGSILIFCVLVFFSSLFDALDGAVARIGNKISKFGSYFDAMCDRFQESVIVLSVASATGYWRESTILIIGALLVSYAKARAAMEVNVSNMEWPDLMERTERGVIYLLGLAASQIFRIKFLDKDIFWWTLVILSVLVYFTVVQRFLRARQIIKERS